MKKTILLLLILIGFIAGCKYDDGPAISFRSFSKRITGYYNLESFTVNGNEMLQAYTDSCGCDMIIEWEFTNGKYKKYCVLTACKGEETWGDFFVTSDKKGVEMAFDSTTQIGYGPLGSKQYSQWDIKRIANKEFWIKSTFSGNEYFLKLKKR
jgi:hypothetical protein